MGFFNKILENPITQVLAPATILPSVASRLVSGSKEDAEQEKILASQRELEEAQRRAQTQEYSNVAGRNDLIRDQIAGRMRGQNLFGDERQLTSGSMDVLGRRADLSQGLNAREMDAARTQGRNEVNANTQGQLRQLQAIQGAQGLKGGLAASQQARVLGEGGRRVQDMERDLVLANIQARRQGIQDYSGELNRRLFGIQASETGQAQLGLQQRGLEQGLAIAGQPAPQPQMGLLGGVTQEISVICTEMNRQGLLSKNIRLADEVFGSNMKRTRPEVYAGYYCWAKYVVRVMKKSKRFTKFVCFFGLPWAKQMAYEQGYLGRGSILGAAIMKVGVPFCALIGKLILKKGKYARA